MVRVVAVDGLPRRFRILRNYTLLSPNRHVMDNDLEPLSIQIAERYQVLVLMDFTQPIFVILLFAIKLWPPSQNTCSMLAQQITNDLSSQSVFPEEFGSLNKEKAGENAKEIVDSAFTSASEHYAKEPDGFGSSALQLYAKEFGKLILEVLTITKENGELLILEVLTRTKENAKLAGPHETLFDISKGLSGFIRAEEAQKLLSPIKDPRNFYTKICFNNRFFGLDAARIAEPISLKGKGGTKN